LFRKKTEKLLSEKNISKTGRKLIQYKFYINAMHKIIEEYNS